MQDKRIVLDLCSGTGSWSRPYSDAGYDVICVDILHGQDVLTYEPPSNVHGILAAPPCTDFASSGARYWKQKDNDGRTQYSLEVVDACLRIITVAKPLWWALENPIGRLRALRELGEPTLTFDPIDYGDNYTKRTQIWGIFNVPPKDRGPYYELCKAYNYKVAYIRNRHRGPARSITSSYFAKAFYNANP